LGGMLNLCARPRLAVAAMLSLPIFAPCQQPIRNVQQLENVARPLQFEVAAIRLDHSNDLVRSFWFTQDGISIKGIPLEGILKSAFLSLHEYGEGRILGEPHWVKSDLYDIQARVGDSDVPRWKKLPMSQQQLALRALVVDRFQLRFHRISRVSSVYVLSVDGHRPKLKSSAHPPHMFNPDEPGHLQSHSTYMWQLIDELQNQLNCMVLDETGLNAAYDYTLQWTPDDQAHAESFGPSLFTALKEQLGLKLVMEKRPVDVFVIDHIERPSQN
jgi:uncharacterized protein (TIGR03435 family)